MSDESVETILNVLKDFHRVTGLELNEDKTQLMVVGAERWIVGKIIHGITVVDAVKLLGVVIDRKLERLDNNWDRVIATMRNLCRYWSNFGLSVTGRVAVGKTYIISQCVYLMGTLPMPAIKGDIINNILVDFVSGNDRPIERRRHFVKAEIGGYGLFDVNLLNMCIKAMWISRWKREGEYRDYSGAVGIMDMTSDTIGRTNIDRSMSANAEIFECWARFKEEYYSFGNNIKDAQLFCNDTLSVDKVSYVEDEIFPHGRRQLIRENAVNCNIAMLTTGVGALKEKNEVERVLGIAITWAEYFRLRGVVERVLRVFGSEVDENMDRVDLESFVRSNRKGCRRYRNIVTGRNSKGYKNFDVRSIRPLRTMWDANIENMSRTLIESYLGIWKLGILDSELKDFLFRLMHGKLYLNNQRANFGPVNRWCTFCGILKTRELKNRGINRDNAIFEAELEQLPVETTDHLLW
jgi:hypothetical protein